MLNEEVILKVMKALEDTKNVYRKQAGQPPEEVNSYNYYQASRQIIKEAIEAQKLIVKRTLGSSHFT
jgi:hypothetical protein